MIKEILLDFFQYHHANGLEVYNEAGVQHELAIHLRQALPDHTIRLEYPITRIYRPIRHFRKKELDIYITGVNGEKYLIEMKVPRENCGTPKSMYHAIEDIQFAEELKAIGFTACYSILLTERKSFWQAPQADTGIYFKFNGESVNIDTLEITDLPKFLVKKGPIPLTNQYKELWREFCDADNNSWKYYVIEV